MTVSHLLSKRCFRYYIWRRYWTAMTVLGTNNSKRYLSKSGPARKQDTSNKTGVVIIWNQPKKSTNTKHYIYQTCASSSLIPPKKNGWHVMIPRQNTDFFPTGPPGSINFLWAWMVIPPFSWVGVSKNHGTPKSSILIGFSIINHPFWGTPIFGNTQVLPLLLGWWSHPLYYRETMEVETLLGGSPPHSVSGW